MLKKLLLIWGRQFLEPPRAPEPLATPLHGDLKTGNTEESYGYQGRDAPELYDAQ